MHASLYLLVQRTRASVLRICSTLLIWPTSAPNQICNKPNQSNRAKHLEPTSPREIPVAAFRIMDQFSYNQLPIKAQNTKPAQGSHPTPPKHLNPGRLPLTTSSMRAKNAWNFHSWTSWQTHFALITHLVSKQWAVLPLSPIAILPEVIPSPQNPPFLV